MFISIRKPNRHGLLGSNIELTQKAESNKNDGTYFVKTGRYDFSLTENEFQNLKKKFVSYKENLFTYDVILNQNDLEKLILSKVYQK